MRIKKVLSFIIFAILTGTFVSSCTEESYGESLPQTTTEMPQTTTEKPKETTTFQPNTTAPIQNTTITLSFAGDCTLGRDDAMPYDVSFNNYYDKYDPGFFFENVKSIFNSSDLSVVDMEGTLTTQETREDKQFAFRAPLEYVDVLKLGGIDAVTIANNHSYDYGQKSYEETVDTLRANGITVFGNDLIEVVDVKGIKVGLVGVYALEGTLEDPEQIRANITAAREKGAQIVVVFFHWGIEYTFQPDQTQLMLGHNAVDWGADLVVGCHVHCMQTIEAYKGTNIVYALGNFSFGGNWYPRDIDAMIYQHSFTVDSSGKIVATDYQVIPCLITSIPPQNNYQPTPATEDEKMRIQNKLQNLSPTLTIKFSE